MDPRGRTAQDMIQTEWYYTESRAVKLQSSTFSFRKVVMQLGLTKFSGNLVLGGNFRKFPEIFPILNITDNRGTSVDLNETMHVMSMSTINHENNVLVLLFVHRGAVTVDIK